MDTIIGIPVENDAGLQSKISDHFGKAPFYLLYNSTKKSATVIKNTSNHFGGKEHPPVLLKNAGAQVILTGSIGEHAQEIFAKFNIKVYAGAKNTVQETLNLYQANKLPLASTVEHKEEHQHHHDH